MQNYIGVKIVKAEPMTKGEFEKMKGAVSPLLEKDDTAGYLGSTQTAMYPGARRMCLRKHIGCLTARTSLCRNKKMWS